MASVSPLPRSESRIPMRMFVRLSKLGHGEFEMAPTMEISRHGARVVSRSPWQPDQTVFVRSILNASYCLLARVVHCQQVRVDGYMVGLELLSPTREWSTLAENGKA